MEALNSLSKKIIDAFNESAFSLSDNFDTYCSKGCLSLINDYLCFLEKLNPHCVMIVSSTSIDSICLIYALVISNRTYVSMATNTSPTFLKKNLFDTQADIIFFDNSWLKVNNNPFYCKPFKNLYFFHNQSQKSYCLLPGILYSTSGSCGQAKFVHYRFNVIFNYLSWCANTFNITVTDAFLMTTPMCFIASLRAVFLPLFNQCNLYLLDTSLANKIYAIIQNIQKNNITVMNITPSILNQLLIHSKSMNILTQLASIKLIFLSGEPINPIDINDWFEGISTKVNFYNLYGATEYLVPLHQKIVYGQTQKEMQFLDNQRLGINVNFKHEDKHFYSLILSGEIATGYLDSQLNSKNFSIENNRRLFKSSDLFELKDNKAKFYDRQDSLIKRFGNKVSLLDLENIIKHSVLDADCVVILIHNTQIALCILAKKSEQKILAIKKYFIAKNLSHMLPDRYFFISQFPKTHSGKVDRKKLKNDISEIDNNNITEFFAKFFPKDQLDETTSLISLGLTSIDYIHLSEMLLTKLGKRFDISKVDDAFKISDLLKLTDNYFSFDGKETKKVQLSILQQSVYYHELSRKNFGWHVHYIYYFRLVRGIDLKRLSKSIEQTIANNFMLSCKLQREGNNYYFVRVKAPSTTLLKRRFSQNAKSEKFLITDIYSNRLVQIYLQKRGLHYYIVMAYHHVAIDGWSAANIRNEIFLRYTGQFIPKWFNQKEEIALLNNVNKTPEVDANVDELINLFSDINVKAHSQLAPFFTDINQDENTSFSINKNIINNYKIENNINFIPASSFFLLNLTACLTKITKKKSFLYSVSLSNRMHNTPHVKKLIMNMVTGLPLFISTLNKTYKEVANDINNKLSLYFKYMDYQSIISFYKSSKIKKIQKEYYKNPYKIYFTFVGKVSEKDYASEAFIDWQQSKTNIFLGSTGIIFLRIFDVGDKYIVNIGTRVNNGVHQALVNEFKNKINC